MSFMVYDLVLLVLFVIFIASFLYNRRKNLKKEGLLFLYRTSWGIKLINYVGKKYKKTLKVLGYVSITLGYILMAGMLYLFGKIIWLYVFHQNIVQAIKVPPIMPLVPYLPQAFKLEFLPPFYFTYWIIIIAIIAITHEFAHGIFAAREKIKIKNTGFGFFPFFLPIFLAAFVELDEKKMAKKSKFSQMAVLSAGTFANVLTAILFIIIFVVFFFLAFAPAGVVFDTYVTSPIAITAISSVNGIAIQNSSYQNILAQINETGFSEIQTNGKTYLTTKELLEQQSPSQKEIIVYDYAPAIRAGLIGAITEIDDVKITSMGGLVEELSKKSSRDKVNIKTRTEEEILEYQITLEQHPEYQTRAWLGIGFAEEKSSGITGKVYSYVTSFKEPHVYYAPKINGFSIFIYNLLWWIILISISIALINMLPVGIFDGGRFFYLTVLALTKSEKKAKKAFSFMTQLIIFLLLLLMIFWMFSVF